MFVSFTFDVDNKIKDKLEELALKEDRSLSAQLRVILDEYFERKK